MGNPAINPAVAARLRQMMAQRGQAQAGGAPPAGAQPDAASNQINQALAGLQKVNPQQLLQVNSQIRKLIANLVAKSSEAVPGASRNWAATLKLFDNVESELKKAIATEAAAGPPIQNSMAAAPAPSQRPPGVLGA